MQFLVIMLGFAKILGKIDLTVIITKDKWKDWLELMQEKVLVMVVVKVLVALSMGGLML
jgi:hypothetical protein